jgi:nicotinamide mononucleotide transporter
MDAPLMDSQPLSWATLLQQAWQAMSGWEMAAVFLSISYLLLALRENSLCWYAAFASTLIYMVLFWDVQLLMDSALQVYYAIMAVYGWYLWRQHGPLEDTRPIQVWPMHYHLLCLALIIILSFSSGYWLSHNTGASWPYLDSFTTWASVITTYMVAQKVLENWLYWVIIDLFAIILYLDRGLYLTALLFVAYVIIAAFGFFSWLRHYQQRQLQQHPLQAELA